MNNMPEPDDMYDELDDILLLPLDDMWDESVPLLPVEAADEMGEEATVGNTNGPLPLPLPVERVEATVGNTDGPLPVPVERVDATVDGDDHYQFLLSHLVQQEAVSSSEPAPVEATSTKEATASTGKKRKKKGAEKESTVGEEPGSKRKRSTEPQTDPETAVNREPWKWISLGHPAFPPADFTRLFGMSGSTLDHLCGLLDDAVGKKTTKQTPRAFIPVHTRVALCVWRLISGEPLRQVAGRFDGLALSTCHKIFHEVCAAIKAKIFSQAVVWRDAAANASKFQALSGIPGIIGAVYTTHVAIAPPEHHLIDYYNPSATARNSSDKPSPSYSVKLQAAVNADGTFSEVFAGHPGAKSDEETLLASSLSTPDESMRLVGGAGYPLKEWMLVPYSHENLTPEQQSFNESLEKARAVGVDAFRRLKARWGYLQTRVEIKLKTKNATDVDLASVLEVCCALHNFCEGLGESLNPELLQAVKLDDDGGHMVAKDDNPLPSASDLRDSLARNLDLYLVS